MSGGIRAPTLALMSTTDTVTATPLGGPTLPQERRLVTSIPGPRSQELLARKAVAVAAGVGHTAPIEAVAAGGGVIVDADGNSLIDLGSGIAVTTLGNAHPKVVAAVQDQRAEVSAPEASDGDGRRGLAPADPLTLGATPARPQELPRAVLEIPE